MAALPAGWRVAAAPGLRRLAGGRLLVGGSPLRMVTLSERGGRLLEAWMAGEPVSGARLEGLLARRLVDAGLADPVPPAACDGPPLTVVVPVYGSAATLGRCLAGLGGRDPVLVVDDSSPDPQAIAAVARRFGAGCVRHERNRGPAAARNTGLRLAETEAVAFLDADCLPGSGFPRSLLAHLADPAVALVAPRIVAERSAPGMIARYERGRSALDMGLRAAMVRPFGSVAFVPAAALVARRSALGAGFDERLRVGEDVDLVWRLGDEGWRVRYEPSVTVGHPARPGVGAWYLRRVAYHSSAAALHRRHPGRVPVLHLSPAAGAAWSAALAGRPAAVGLLTLARAARLRRLLARRSAARGEAVSTAARVAVAATAREGSEVARALVGPWSPLLALLGRRASVLVLVWLLACWRSERPEVGPLSYAILRLAEESARGAGIWLGCLGARDPGPLLPAPVPRRPQPIRDWTPTPSSS